MYRYREIRSGRYAVYVRGQEDSIGYVRRRGSSWVGETRDGLETTPCAFRDQAADLLLQLVG